MSKLPHGWFMIPGVQSGDRTLAEQARALAPALAECSGKSVADIGCAEGLLALEFAKAGARSVFALDHNAKMISVALSEQRKIAPLANQVDFYMKDFAELSTENTAESRRLRFDIVLALGVFHKLRDPSIGVKFAAGCCLDLLLVRSGRGARGRVVISKHHERQHFDMGAFLTSEGFWLEKVVAGPQGRGEDVDYWRRRGSR